MAKYSYKCVVCHYPRTIELDYNSDIPPLLICGCENIMKREYKTMTFHLKGSGWGKDSKGNDLK